MANENIPSAESAVELIVTLERSIQISKEAQDKNKNILRQFYPNSKFTSTDGSIVSVSKETSDRTDGTKLEFSEEKYAELPPEIKAVLERTGVIKLVPKIVKGQSPKITVKLSA